MSITQHKTISSDLGITIRIECTICGWHLYNPINTFKIYCSDVCGYRIPPLTLYEHYFDIDPHVDIDNVFANITDGVTTELRKLDDHRVEEIISIHGSNTSVKNINIIYDCNENSYTIAGRCDVLITEGVYQLKTRSAKLETRIAVDDSNRMMSIVLKYSDYNETHIIWFDPEGYIFKETTHIDSNYKEEI